MPLILVTETNPGHAQWGDGGAVVSEVSVWKEPVQLSTLGLGDISLVPAADPIDGVALNLNDRIAVVDQADGSQNGIYRFDGTNLVRTDDYAVTATNIQAGVKTYVQKGFANAKKTLRLFAPTSPTAIVVGTTATSWEADSGGTIEDEGVALPGTYTTLNFIGAGVTATNAGGGVADITIPGGGAGSSNSTLLLGAGSLASSTTTRYLFPGYDDSLAQTVPAQLVAPFTGTLRNLYIRHNVIAGNGNAIVYTVRVNGVATGLTVSLASTALQGSNLVNTVAVVAGDRIDIEVTKAASIASSPLDVTATLNLQVP